MTYARALAIAAEYLPGEDEDFIGYLIWNHTGFPGFFDGDPEDCFRAQIAADADTLRRCAPLIDDVERLLLQELPA